MRKDFGVKPFLCPQLVMIIGTYDAFGNPNVMNAAWGGMADYDKVMVCMSSHKTTKNIEVTNEFTISIGNASCVMQCDYVGIVSMDKEPNKMEKSKFTTTKAKYVNAPIVNELGLCLECRLIKILEEDLYLAQIVNVNAKEDVLDEYGNISLEKLEPIVYSPTDHKYYKIGEKVGNAFSDGKKLV